MFDFLKPKTKMTPEEFGILVADIFSSQFLPKLVEYVSEYKKYSDITDSEIKKLFDIYIMLECTILSVEIESASISEDNKKIILDSFWTSVSESLKEKYSEEDALVFESNTSKVYPKIKELVVNPSPHPIRWGMLLFQLAMPDKDPKENLDIVNQLTFDFTAIFSSKTEFIRDILKNTKFK